jgi:anti-sigma factor RsiW
MTVHEQISELLPAFALAELTGPQVSQVQAHLAECQQCRVELDRLRHLLAHTQQVQAFRMSSDVAEAAEQRLLAGLQTQSADGSANRLLYFSSNLWNRFKESRIMQSRSRSLVAAIAATIVVSLGALTVFHANICRATRLGDR